VEIFSTGGKTSINENEHSLSLSFTISIYLSFKQPLISRFNAKGKERSYLGKKSFPYPHFWLRQGHQAGHAFLGLMGEG
jgi:hypothetical protein